MSQLPQLNPLLVEEAFTFTKENLFSLCEEVSPGFSETLSRFSNMGSLYISGGTLTIACLNKFKMKSIPPFHINDIDIFVTPNNDSNPYIYSDLERQGYIKLGNQGYNRVSRSQFDSFYNEDTRINITICPFGSSLKDILSRFDLTCNLIGYDVSNEIFVYSNSFIDFLDTEVMGLVCHTPTTFARWLYKIFQYKLDPWKQDTHLFDGRLDVINDKDLGYKSPLYSPNMESISQELTKMVVNNLYMTSSYSFSPSTPLFYETTSICF